MILQISIPLTRGSVLVGVPPQRFTARIMQNKVRLGKAGLNQIEFICLLQVLQPLYHTDKHFNVHRQILPAVFPKLSWSRNSS